MNGRRATVGTWFAIIGSILEAVAITLFALAFLVGMAELGGEFNWTGLAPALILVAVLLILAYGFVRRSRVAFVIGLLLYGWTLIGQIWVVVSGNFLAGTVVPYAVGLPAALVVVGFALSWPRYWRRAF